MASRLLAAIITANDMNRITRKVQHLTEIAWHEPAFWLVAIAQYHHLQRYRVLRTMFAKMYRQIQTDMSAFTTPSWAAFNTSLEQSLLPIPPYSFLRDQTISSTMVMTKGGSILREQLHWLKREWQDLVHALHEDPVGHPSIANWRHLVSHNTVHQMYHLGRFLKSTNANMQAIRRIVEWGGGYGNFARLFIRQAPRVSYTIIDTPLLCTLQWLYLSSVFGSEAVKLVTRPNQSVMDSGITIIPVQWFNSFNLSADLFVSTWAISESPHHLQEAVARTWFDAKHLLIGFQDSRPAFPDAGNIGDLARKSGAVIEDLPHMSGNHYAFR